MKTGKPKSNFLSAGRLLILCVITGFVFFWGLRTGHTAVPVRGQSKDLARVAHPVWFWVLEAFWFTIYILTGAGAIMDIRKPGQDVASAHFVAGQARAPSEAGSELLKTPPSSGSDPAIKSTSPGGRNIIRVHSQEMRMSHWVDTPELIDTVANRTLFAPKDSNWSMDSAVWRDASVVDMVLRMYPGAHSPIKATFDCARHTATIGGIAVSDIGNSSELERALKKAYQASKSTYKPIEG
jgi:hypothetical protein